MADEKIKKDGRPPGFVNMDRGEQTYNGVADTVALWAQARAVVMLKNGVDYEPPREEVIKEFNALLQLALHDEVDTYFLKEKKIAHQIKVLH